MRYQIEDWAGNVVNVNRKTFPTFQCAWDYILSEMTDVANLTEEDYQEYFVEEIMS